jgi:tight adherence protein C
MNPFDLFGPDGGGDVLIVAVAAIAAFINVYFVYRVTLVRDPLAPRLKALEERRKALRAGVIGPKRRATRREKSMSFARQTVNHFNLLRTREAQRATIKLMKAGWRSRDALTIYLFLRLALPLVFGVVAMLFVYVFKMWDLTGMMKPGACILAVILGAYAPDIYIKNTTTKRQLKLQRGLPDALDLLVICAEAGQSLDAALNRVSRELVNNSPELAEELSLTAIELGLLPERRQALENLNKRTDLPSIRGVVNTLLQTERYGTPLSQSLRVLAAEFRHDRLMAAEAKAARLPATLTVPLIIFILPPLFVILIGPAIMRAVDTISHLGF